MAPALRSLRALGTQWDTGSHDHSDPQTGFVVVPAGKKERKMNSHEPSWAGTSHPLPVACPLIAP
jgi:hypothetical protein